MTGPETSAADNTFHLTLTDAEKRCLHDLVRLRIGQMLQGKTAPLPLPPGFETGVLHAELGAFVTLNLNGQLRGCIGNLIGTGPLYRTVAAMAEAAAFNDPRFPPVNAAEFPNLETSISIMGPITPCPDPAGIIIGRHGLIVRQGKRQGLLLPQVAVEWEWDRETFLAQTCRKAGLPLDAWKQPGTLLFWFEAEVV